MEGVAVQRQLVGQIQELWEVYGSFSLNHPHLNPRWYLLDLDNNSVEDDFCGLIMGEKSECQNMVEANKSPPCKRSRREKNRERSLVSSSTEMEQQIWKEFHEDLFEAVIARLPIATFFRFRSVCRKWNSLLTSNSFSQHFAEVPRVHPWFYTITHEDVNSGAMYDPSMRKWHHPSIPFLPAKMIILPVASAGGLVCFLDIGHRNFYICNPLTDSFKELPPRSVRVWSRVAVGMILNGNTASNGLRVLFGSANGQQ